MKRKNTIFLLPFLLIAGTLLFTACGSTVTPAPELVPEESKSANITPAPVNSIQYSSFSQNTIQVNSSEKVTVTPDIAEVIYAVRTESKDAASCQQKNSEDINMVIELLKSLGIAETSIQTSDYYMHPIYNYSGNTQKITGYEATASLTVSDLPIDNLGNILTQSVNAGINNIQSITYQSSKYDEGYQEALKLAVNSAKAKAEALAEAGGCSIGGVLNIVENSNYGEARYTDNALAGLMISTPQFREEMKMADSSTNIMPGEIDVEVNITVEYQIQ